MKKFLKKIMIVLLLAFILFYACLWLLSNKKYKVDYGISFSRQHAENLNLDWKIVYSSVLQDLRPKYIRIASTWREVEIDRGVYDFSAIDWQMDEAKNFNTKVVLVVGQKAPRWPECHVPDWSNNLSDLEYETELFKYIKQVVDRYSNNNALEIWQVENEPFIRFRFGNCDRFREDLVSKEIDLVREFDSNHKILITDSGELSTWRKASYAGDLFGTTLYRIVRTPGGKIWSYDFLPSAFYRVKAKLWGVEMKNFIIAELQAEPWFTTSHPNNTPVLEQEKTMNPTRLKKHFDYVESIGSERVYLWGVEWWYWMKEKQNDSRYWDIVKERISA